MNLNPRTTLKKLPSGTIDLEVGADGVYIQFNCDCLDALPYCHAACCALSGTDVTHEEAKDMPANLLSWNPDDQTFVMARNANGFCRQNNPKTGRCNIYEDRPAVCRDFHCSRGAGMRGFHLTLNRLD